MDFEDHEYNERMRRIVSASPYFRVHFLRVWEPSKAIVDLIYEDDRWRRFLPEKNLNRINRGFCSEFARDVVEKCPGARIEFSRNHYFISYECEDGRVRYFDSETPHGVEVEKELPIYQRERNNHKRNRGFNKGLGDYERRRFW